MAEPASIGEHRPLVRVERHGPVAILSIDRPERRNALNQAVKNELLERLSELEGDATVKALVLTGSGGYFVAGSDIAEMASMQPTDHVLLDTDRVFHALRRCSKPVIAAVEGYALGGGCELALSCDIVIAAEDARFGQPEIRVGVMPGAGGTQKLLRAAGPYKTLRWVLTGDMIPARDFWQANLVSELVPAGQALACALAVASRVCTMPPLAVQAIREAVRLGGDLPMEAALALERRYFERLFDSADQAEGMRAFLEKRPARYEGR